MVPWACAHQLQTILCESTSLAGEYVRSPSVVSKIPQPNSRLLYCAGAETESVSLRRYAFFLSISSVKIIPALNFIHLFHSMRLSESCLHIKRVRREVKVSFTILLLEHFLLVAFAPTSHPHLKKSVSLIFATHLLEQIWDALKRQLPS